MSQIKTPYTTGAKAPLTESISYRREQFKEQRTQEQLSAHLDFNAYIVQLFDDFRQLDAQARREQAAAAGEMLRNYDGDSYGEYDQAGNWKPTDKKQGEVAYSLPLLKAHIDSAQMIDLRTELLFDYLPANENSLEQMAIARLMEKYCEKKWSQLWTFEKFQEESLWRLLTGNAVRSFDYAVNTINPKKKKVPKVKIEMISAPDGSQITKAGAELVDVDVPELIFTIDNPLQFQYDLNVQSPNLSSFWIHRDLISIKKAEFYYKIRFPQTANITPEQKIAYDAGRFGVQKDGTVGSASAVRTSNMVSWAEMASREIGFFDLEIYGDTMINVETELPNTVESAKGRIRIIPANSVLGDLFPKGLIIETINGVCVNVRHAGKRLYKDVIRYGIRPANPSGSGLQHLKPMAEIVNDSFNFEYSIAQAEANPITLIWRKYLKKIPGFTRAYFVDNLPDNQSLGNLIHVQQGRSANPIVSFIVEKVQGLMQFVAGTFSQNSGTPDARMNTATGVAAMEQNVNNRILPAIQLRITSDIEARYKLAEFLQITRDEEELTELSDECGSDVVDLFLRSNVRSAVIVKVKKGSDKPQSDLQRVNNLTTFANLANSVKETEFAAEFLPSAADQLNLPISIGYGQESKRQAERRLAMIKQKVKEKAKDEQVREMQPAAVASQICAEILQECEGEFAAVYAEGLVLHVENDVFLETYRDWMLSDAAQNANPVLKFAVAEMMKIHQDRVFEKPILKARIAQEMENRVNPQPDPAEIADQNKAAIEDEKNEQMGQEVLRRAADEEAKDRDSERRMSEREHAADMTVQEKAVEAALNQSEEKEEEKSEK